MDPVLASAIFILGLAFGSFLNVCIYRLPRDLSVVKPRSACPGCEQPISAYDNIPVLSWLILRGHCRHCKTYISVALSDCRSPDWGSLSYLLRALRRQPRNGQVLRFRIPDPRTDLYRRRNPAPARQDDFTRPGAWTGLSAWWCRSMIWLRRFCPAWYLCR